MARSAVRGWGGRSGGKCWLSEGSGIGMWGLGLESRLVESFKEVCVFILVEVLVGVINVRRYFVYCRRVRDGSGRGRLIEVRGLADSGGAAD
jgi:hypothetical protein